MNLTANIAAIVFSGITVAFADVGLRMEDADGFGKTTLPGGRPAIASRRRFGSPSTGTHSISFEV